jgi:ribosomal protein L11 methyltransferase
LSEPVRWIEARVIAPEGWLELVAEALSIDATAGVAFGRPSLATDAAPEGHDFVRVFVPERADSAELRSELESRVARLAVRAGAPELADLRVAFRELAPEDYATSWRKNWKPFRVGRLCVVLPGEARRLRSGDVALALEPGGAFGSGRHPTTRECLRAIQARVRPRERVLDAGSGSGILAVAAVLLGAESALGFDVDPNAKPYADALALQNGVASRCTFTTADFALLDRDRAEFDAVVANIYADVIASELARVSAALVRGGWFAFSGCIESRAGELVETISRSELRIEREVACGRWRTFVGTRSG